MKTSLADLAAYQQAARTQRNASDQLKAGGVEAAAKAFEAMFIKMLLDAMPESEDSAISGGFGGGVRRDMLHQEYASQASKQKALGSPRRSSGRWGLKLRSPPPSPYRRWQARCAERAPLDRVHIRSPVNTTTTLASTMQRRRAPRFVPSWTPRSFLQAPKGAMASWLSCVTQTVRRRATRTLIELMSPSGSVLSAGGCSERSARPVRAPDLTCTLRCVKTVNRSTQSPTSRLRRASPSRGAGAEHRNRVKAFRACTVNWVAERSARRSTRRVG